MVAWWWRQRGGDDDNEVVVARMKMVVGGEGSGVVRWRRWEAEDGWPEVWPDPTFDLAVHDFDWFFDEMNLVIELTFISRND
uniref:Uncharacterized protein n=1 Tax=Tanacetum cinerariifolium TaxID=118510 RepID=A0A699IZ28_TANCI|nr:hypothetical protein [Tanacetum cinerariifolium]